MHIAADICIYTNHNIVQETLWVFWVIINALKARSFKN
jgi:hypothetical protein